MYALLIWTLRKKETHSNEDYGIIGGAADSITESINKKMTLLVKRLVAILLICYVPFIVWREYYFKEVIDEDHANFIGPGEGIPELIVRILVGINSCINPLVYAQTIPAFKDLVRGYIHLAHETRVTLSGSS
jgi:hypothetical protein